MGMLRAALAALLLAACLAPTDGGGIFSVIERRQRMKEVKERKEREWVSEYKAQPQRQRTMHCDPDTGHCYYTGVQGALVAGAGLVACRDCMDPHERGLFITTWETAWEPPAYHVDAEVIYAVPNDASAPPVNPVGGAIVLVHRGTVSLVAKARTVQEAGAAAVIIVDNQGLCGPELRCGARVGDKTAGQPLAHLDDKREWEGIRIPVVMVSKAEGERLVRLLRPQQMEVEGYGQQMFVP